MTSRVLILDGSIYPDIYRPADHWRALLKDVPSDSVHLPTSERVPNLAGYSHVIVSGSEASIMDGASWFEVEAAVLKEAVKQGKPILASCFGHQMLALALSGDAFVRRSLTPEFGWLPIKLIENDELFDGLNNPFYSFVLHFDEVVNPPQPWRVIANSVHCSVQAMRYGDLPIWGIHAHPEIPPSDGKALLKMIVKNNPLAKNLIGPSIDQVPRHDLIGVKIVRRFMTF